MKISAEENGGECDFLLTKVMELRT